MKLGSRKEERNMKNDDTEDTFHSLGRPRKSSLYSCSAPSLSDLIFMGCRDRKVFGGAMGWGPAQNVGFMVIAWP